MKKCLELQSALLESPSAWLEPKPQRQTEASQSLAEAWPRLPRNWLKPWLKPLRGCLEPPYGWLKTDA